MKFYQSFKFKLSVILLLVILVPLIAASYIQLQSSMTTIEAKVYSENANLAKALKNQLEIIIRDLESTMNMLSESQFITSMDPETMDELLKKTVDHHSMISQMYVMNKTGKQIYKTSGTLGDRSDRDYFKSAIQGKLNYSEVIISGSTGKPIVVIALPVKRSDGIVGVIGASIDLNELSHLATETKIGENGYGFIVDRNGKVIGHPNAELVAEMTQLTELLPVSKVITGVEGIDKYVYDGESKFAAYRYLEKTGWGLLVQQPASEAFQAISKQRHQFDMILGIAILLGIIVSILLSNSITRPIQVLKSQMELASEGNFQITIPEKMTSRNDEFGVLSTSFDRMIRQIREIIIDIKKMADDTQSHSGAVLELAEQMGFASEEVAKSINEIAIGATTQAGETGNSLNLTNDLAEKVEAIHEKLKVSVENAGNMRTQNQTGMEAMKNFHLLFNNNIEIIKETGESVNALSENSDFIGSIIETIQEITEQTNLLALNAAIEAARAGEHGKGFAVVANEVRKLASQSHDATNEIQSKIAEITELIDITSTAMENAESISKNATSTLENTELLLEEIGISTDQVGIQIEGLSSDIDFVDLVKNQVLTSIESISSVSEESAASTEEISASMEEMTASLQNIVTSVSALNEQVTELAASVEVFKI